MQLPMPSLKTFIGLPMFLIGYGVQYDCHNYLASLQKYTLPQHPAFARIVAPHYTAECLIYLSLSILGAPPGQIFNRTIFSVLIFTVFMLGATAQTSRQWYAKKFGPDSVNRKWNMIPGVF